MTRFESEQTTGLSVPVEQVARLTVAEFFALPGGEQARIWNQAHLEAERELETLGVDKWNQLSQ